MWSRSAARSLLLAALICAAIFLVQLLLIKSAYAATTKEAVSSGLDCVGSVDADAAILRETSGGSPLTYICKWPSLNYPNPAQYEVSVTREGATQKQPFCALQNSSSACSATGCSCKRTMQADNFKFAITMAGGDKPDLPPSVIGEKVSKELSDAYTFLKTISANEFISGSQMRDADAGYKLLQEKSKTAEEKELLAESGRYISSIRIRRAATLDCQQDSTRQQCINYKREDMAEANPEDSYYRGTAGYTGEVDDGTCSDGVGGDIASLISGNWIKNMLCLVARGLIGIKAFIIDSWLVQGDGDSFGNVLNIADPTLGESNLVVSVWSIIRDVVNALVLISILIMALLNATGFARSKALESFQFQRLIPSIVVAVILVNFSLAICNFFIIAANALTNYMVGPQGLQGIASAGTGLDSIAGKTPGTALFQALFLVVFSLILLYLYILLWVRVVVISLLVMTSGLPYIARILPFKYVQESVSSFWTKQFVNWLLMGPMVGLLVYIAARAIAGLGQSAFLLPQGTENAVSGSPTLTNLIVVTVILYIAATYPLKLGGDIMKRAQGYLKQAREGAGTFTRRTAKGIAVAGQKDEAGAFVKAAGKVASTGLFVTAMPKYLNDQYKAIEESRDKSLGKTWGKGTIRQFVERPLDEKKTEDEADKLKIKSAMAIESKARSSKGWQDRAQGIWAAIKKSTEALTEQERLEAANLARELGYIGDLTKGDWKEIQRLARSGSTVEGRWGGLKDDASQGIADRLKTATLRDIGRIKIDELKEGEFDQIEDSFSDVESAVQPHNDRVYANVEIQLARIFKGKNKLSAQLMNKIRKAVQHNNPAEVERIVKIAAKNAGVAVTDDDMYGDGVSTPHTGIITHMERDSLYQDAQNAYSNDPYSVNARALMGRIKTSQQATEIRRYDDYVIRQNIDPALVRSSMQRDITSLKQAANTSHEQGLLRLKELRRPSYDSRIVANPDGSINKDKTNMSERELASIIESIEEAGRLLDSSDQVDRARLARLRSRSSGVKRKK